ncbi:Serine-protein kinase ATM [Turdus rufiventris]|nr:Serine-protein kinase ATM [Turdus rufiventris]
MNFALHDLLDCCRRLENEKAGERRKEIENFKRLLRDSEIVLQLDRNSESKQGKQLNWDAVFRPILIHIFLYIGLDFLSAYERIITYLKGGPRLKCQELLIYVMEVIRDPTSCAAYGSDCSSILLKDILSVRKYWCEIPQQQWSGAYDLTKWQSILHNLYDLLVNEINLISSRGKYSSGSRNIAVKENLIELMADICHQVFTEGTKVLEITQSYAVSQRESGEDTVPNKRRRIELSWGVIRDNLQRSQKDFDVIPWLQITSQLISKYPMSLPNSELPALLNVLHQLLPQQRRGERTPYVLKCLSEVAFCQSQKTDLKSTHKLELQRTWAKIWTLTIRSVSLQQVEVESFGLLGAMIQGNLVVTDKELWKIFSGPACKPSSSAVCCLSLVMSAYSVPENLDIGMEQNSSERNLGSVLREAIMKWLLSSYLEEEIEECAELPPVLRSEQHVQVKEGNNFSDVEELYLQTTFDEMDIFTNFAAKAADKNVTGSRLAINQNLRETLENCLLAMSEKLLSTCGPTSKVVTAEHLVRCVSLLVGVLGCYCYTGIFKEEDACKSALFQNAKNSANKMLSNIFLRLLTSKFMNDLIDICKNLLTVTGKSSVPGKVDLRNDPEESIMEVDNLASDDLFDDHSVTDISDTNESGDLQTVTGALSPLAEEQLTKQDLLLLEIVRFLCISVTTVQVQTLSFRASDIRRRLLMLTEGSVFDSTKPLHLHMYLILLKELPAEGHPLPAVDVDMLLKPLSTVCSLYRRDQEVCKVILNNLLPIAVGLAQFDEHAAEEAGSAKGQFLTVVEAFCVSSVHFKSHINFHQVDPHCKWAILHVKNKDLPVLKKVSDIFGYKSIEDFMTSHLDYLVMEWLKINDSGYSLSAFPYVLLNYTSLEEFYRSCYKVLVPHLVIRSQFEDVKSLANKIEKDWRQVLAECFPKLLVNILPYFAYQSHGKSEVAEQREMASKVYDMLKDENCLGKQQIDNLSHSNLPEIVVELLMTLHEPAATTVEEGSHLSKYIRELDPAPNPPHFPSYVIKATLDYISSCHKSKLKSIVAVLSKSPDSFQKILLALCKHASDTKNLYKKHRVLTIYHLFVGLLLKEIKDSLGGAWAFVLRDVIYTLIHHINSRPVIVRDISVRSFALCCDLLHHVCHTAVTCCSDALETHLHVIVGTLIPLAMDQSQVQEQVLALLKYLVIDNKDNESLYQAIKCLDPFPEYPPFKDLRATQQKIKYSKGPYSLLEEINHFLSVGVCDSLPLTRLEGLYDLRKKLEQYKDQMKDLLKIFQEKPEDSVVVKLVVSLLQLSKMAVNHTGEKAVLEAVGSCLGEIGPMDFSTTALQRAENALDSRAADLLEDRKLQCVFIMLSQINTALTDNCIDVRAAAVSCLKNILATKSGSEFWDIYKSKADPMLIYLQPFRTSRKKFLEVSGNDIEAPLERLNDTNLWIPLGESHETWIKHLTSSILDSGGVKNEVLQLMKPLCEVKTDLCQTLLPYLIHDILLHDSDESWKNLLSLHIQKFFTACCKFASSNRSTPNSDSGTVFDDSFWLDLNYLEVAIAAQSCAAHFTALLYTEIYADKINRDKQQERIRTYEHEAVWEKALVTYDLETSLSPSTRQAGIIEALQNFGLCHTLSMYLKGLEHENTEWCAELQEIRYQAAWRNMQWNHISSVKDEAGRPGYHESLYDALQSLRDKEFSAFHDSLKDARSVTTQQLNDVYLKWQRQSQLLKDSDFHFQEPVMALRTVILEILLEKESENTKRECIKDLLTKHLVELSRLARTAKNTQLPERAMFQIKQHNPNGNGVCEWQLEEAQVFWAKKEESLALNILKTMIKKLDADWFQVEKDPHLKLMYTECLRLCGTWLAETCLENPTVIMQKYLEKAVEIAASHSGDSSDELKKGKMKAFLSLARFSDNQYQRIENYMKSSEFENKQALLKKAKEEVGLIRERRVQTNRYTVKVQRELELDEGAIQALTEDRKRFLCKAVENYISCLLSGEEHDMWMFRLCSLWLENSGVDRVNEMMTLMSRISLDHPHHTLFIILALANANKDELLTKPDAIRRNKLTKNAPKEISQLDVDRMEAARTIINIVRTRRPAMVRDIEALCDAYITLANLDSTPWKSQRKGISIPADQPIIKLKNLEDVAVPTMEIKVDPTGQYENLVTISSFKREFRLAGGMNLPKIIDCVGSDGKERRQLVKGRDDLRQDAVMQQVFQMCNTLLQQNTETRKRKLNIRRYKVVPLSQRSGVLEWCSGTTPIGEFLVNAEEGAHKRYRPKDFSSYQCHKIMLDAQKKHSEEKYKIFMEICEKFQPVFRYFCMEKFLDPAVWFEKRLAYTRSVATSSIVGYILGLGDRHVQNILIDEQTAELVHIDLGVAFEQGKILPTPETVPFRLTRDIVDGMGITGVEGVFRRCCEKTMAVMRNSQEALLTIVEVLLYDPLFDWTMNPLKALYLQQRPEDEADMNSTLGTDPQEPKRKASSDDQSFNKVAERVLMRLQEKLKGVEEGTVLSVGGQVNLLIQQAMDPKNLSRLFPGWKPWV